MLGLAVADWGKLRLVLAGLGYLWLAVGGLSVLALRAGAALCRQDIALTGAGWS